MNSQIRELVNRAEADVSDESASLASKRRNVRYLQELTIYFWVFSIGGHYIEVFWAWLTEIITGHPAWHPIMPTFLPLAPPYGFGVVVVILIVAPLIKRYKLHPVIGFLLCSFFTGLVEYICAAGVVLVEGYNRYWDYSHQAFNFNGYTSVEASLTFGILATFFIYLIYPLFEKVLRRTDSTVINIIFWLMVSTYGLDLLLSGLMR